MKKPTKYQKEKMHNNAVVMTTEFPELPAPKRGKVRDIYDLGNKLLLVATDRISAFDVVLPNGIPDKGKVLTQLSAFWFEYTKPLIPNHLITTTITEFPAETKKYQDILSGRTMLVKKSQLIEIE